MSIYFPHGWHARAQPLPPSFPPASYLHLNAAFAVFSEAMYGPSTNLALFYPNLALDAQGVALALHPRDWNALVGLAQRAGCLAPELTLTGLLTRESYNVDDEDYNDWWRSWAIDTGWSCQSTDSIHTPYGRTSESEFWRRLAVAGSGSGSARVGGNEVPWLNSEYTSFSLTGFDSTIRNLEGGGLLPTFLHELFVVLRETYNKRRDAPPPIVNPWFIVCPSIAPSLGRQSKYSCDRDWH
jgi:hypothetical protein